MASASAKVQSSLVLFARTPRRGEVKTRLAALLGDERALHLYRAFLADACALAARASVLGVERLVLAVAGAFDDPEIGRLATAHGLHARPQPDGDLGTRMHALLTGELERAERVCLIGTDSPTLTADQVVAAFGPLADADVVIGPAADGGYWLLGARAPEPALFDGVPWSSPRVLTETLRRLRGRKVALLPFHYDVDEAADLELLAAHLPFVPEEIAPATRAALAALGL
jgi:rSAM/selenodomain-associated transferase 1